MNESSANIPSTTTSVDAVKYKKMKRAVFFGVIISLIIIGWHLYEFYLRARFEADRATATEHDIMNLTLKLYADEMQYNSYPLKVNFQGKTLTYKKDDQAPENLLEVPKTLFTENPTSTISLMCRLFDNYALNTRTFEVFTAEEKKEEIDFLNAVLDTKVMQRTMEFLEHRNMVSSSRAAKLSLLADLWFTPYSRGGHVLGSSGFEHVFMAELKNRQSVLGLHNWVYFHDQESKGLLNYKGYLKRIDFEGKNQHLLALRFTFHDYMKPYNTLFIGTSPEFEMSLYTVCFLLRMSEPCQVQLGDKTFNIITHLWDKNGVKSIATAYPMVDY